LTPIPPGQHKHGSTSPKPEGKAKQTKSNSRRELDFVCFEGLGLGASRALQGGVFGVK
jgi:hypothetical protein